MVFPGTYPNLNPKARPRVRVRIRIRGLRTIKWAIKLAVKNERQRGKRKPEKSSEYIDSPPQNTKNSVSRNQQLQISFLAISSLISQ